jgi:hypothetical protein
MVAVATPRVARMHPRIRIGKSISVATIVLISLREMQCTPKPPGFKLRNRSSRFDEDSGFC